MFCHRYKNGWIHGYFDRDECAVQTELDDTVRKVKSYRAAQLLITKMIKLGSA